MREVRILEFMWKGLSEVGVGGLLGSLRPPDT